MASILLSMLGSSGFGGGYGSPSRGTRGAVDWAREEVPKREGFAPKSDDAAGWDWPKRGVGLTVGWPKRLGWDWPNNEVAGAGGAPKREGVAGGAPKRDPDAAGAPKREGVAPGWDAPNSDVGC
jgi:hypothetical protein